MAKLREVILLIAAIVFVTSVACAAANPAVSFAFNPATFEYSWTVNCTSATTVQFYQFTVYSTIPQATWITLGTSQSGPWVGGVNKGWTYTASAGAGTNMNAKWDAPSGQGVAAGTTWTGVFKIIVPNTAPVAGQVKTYGGLATTNYVNTSVPGSMVPEPSSMIVFGSMVAGLAPFVIRRRK
jgi:hypothetical protein